MDLKDIYGGFPPTGTKYIFFSTTHGTFFRIYCTLGHKRSLNKFKRIEIISSAFSDHNGIKLEINNRGKAAKSTNKGKLNNILLNNQNVKEEIERENFKYLETMKMETQYTQTYEIPQKYKGL